MREGFYAGAEAYQESAGQVLIVDVESAHIYKDLQAEIDHFKAGKP